MRMVVLVVAAALSATNCVKAEEVPPDHQYQSNGFCLQEDRWDEVVTFSKVFASQNDLEVAGGTDGASLNLMLTQGETWLRGADLKLWLLDSGKGLGDFSAISREPMTDKDVALARAYLSGLKLVGCPKS